MDNKIYTGKGYKGIVLHEIALVSEYLIELELADPDRCELIHSSIRKLYEIHDRVQVIGDYIFASDPDGEPYSRDDFKETLELYDKFDEEMKALYNASPVKGYYSTRVWRIDDVVSNMEQVFEEEKLFFEDGRESEVVDIYSKHQTILELKRQEIRDKIYSRPTHSLLERSDYPSYLSEMISRLYTIDDLMGKFLESTKNLPIEYPHLDKMYDNIINIISNLPQPYPKGELFAYESDFSDILDSVEEMILLSQKIVNSFVDINAPFDTHDPNKVVLYSKSLNDKMSHIYKHTLKDNYFHTTLNIYEWGFILNIMERLKDINKKMDELSSKFKDSELDSMVVWKELLGKVNDICKNLTHPFILGVYPRIRDEKFTEDLSELERLITVGEDIFNDLTKSQKAEHKIEGFHVDAVLTDEIEDQLNSIEDYMTWNTPPHVGLMGSQLRAIPMWTLDEHSRLYEKLENELYLRVENMSKDIDSLYESFKEQEGQKRNDWNVVYSEMVSILKGLPTYLSIQDSDDEGRSNWAKEVDKISSLIRAGQELLNEKAETTHTFAFTRHKELISHRQSEMRDVFDECLKYEFSQYTVVNISILISRLHSINMRLDDIFTDLAVDKHTLDLFYYIYKEIVVHLESLGTHFPPVDDLNRGPYKEDLDSIEALISEAKDILKEINDEDEQPCIGPRTHVVRTCMDCKKATLHEIGQDVCDEDAYICTECKLLTVDYDLKSQLLPIDKDLAYNVQRGRCFVCEEPTINSAVELDDGTLAYLCEQHDTTRLDEQEFEYYGKVASNDVFVFDDCHECQTKMAPIYYKYISDGYYRQRCLTCGSTYVKREKRLLNLTQNSD